MLEDLGRKVDYRIELSGGQNRLKESILYVCQKASEMEFFGAIKLNKILWRADFKSFAERQVPVTGRQYQRLAMGPAPVEMPPVVNDLLRDGAIVIERRKVGRHEEKRHIAKVGPVLRMFSPEDLDYLDEAIEHYRFLTGTEASDESHGIAWKTRDDGDPMPYQSAYFEDKPLSDNALEKLTGIAKAKKWQSS
ncbi:SocA family protein [Rhizobium sp. TH2]|uniref:Panacea domain-containing protein n=1 Tax=Rhizobium sp. TH2 TaxID=2775403 RepID=UPI0021585710|nr:Panacea domain-containing protein [Rhizobium sp. TH2]UVC08446.1 SocA family protein [Rhizobium sp. TH2]